MRRDLGRHRGRATPCGRPVSEPGNVTMRALLTEMLRKECPRPRHGANEMTLSPCVNTNQQDIEVLSPLS
jgi:hypothetical protein